MDEKNMNASDIIHGDLFEGIVVDELEDRDSRFTIDGAEVSVAQRVNSPKEDRKVLGFLFLMEAPQRFRLDVLIPENCKNAQVSLNDKELLGFFSKDIPEDPEYVEVTHCNDANKYTPLCPGKFQSLNFRWESGDVLKFFFYY